MLLPLHIKCIYPWLLVAAVLRTNSSNHSKFSSLNNIHKLICSKHTIICGWKAHQTWIWKAPANDKGFQERKKTKKKLWLLLLADFVASPAPQMHSSLNLLNINIYNNCNKSSTGNLGEWGNVQQMAKIQKMFYGGDQYENLCAFLGFVAWEFTPAPPFLAHRTHSRNAL